MNRIAVIIGLMLGVLISFLGLEQTIGDGGFPLSVTVRAAGPKAVKKATYGVCATANEAHKFIEPGIRHRPSDLWTVVDDPFTGGPLTIAVPVSTHSTFFGLKQSYVQFEFLAIIVEYADGMRETKVVDIPDGRKTRAVTVIVP